MRTFTVLLFTFLLFGCYVHIKTNGHSYALTSERHIPNYGEIIIIGKYDNIKIPAEAKLLSRTSVRSPLQGGLPTSKWAFFSHYARLIDYARYETDRLGGNILQVIDYHNFFTSKYLSSKIMVQI